MKAGLSDRTPPRGFALIVTISLLVLLMVLGVGLLSLSAISLRGASQGSARAEAQANARLAVLMAIGELQNSVGRDENITAPASILDSTPDTETADGVKYPHLTGVWAAREERLGEDPDYDREGPFRRWLVSHADPDEVESITMAQGGNLDDPVLMANPPSRPDLASDAGRVEAGRVPIGNGAYAWWAGDENCKAYVGLRDDIDRDSSATMGDRLTSFATPGAHGLKALEEFEEFPSNTESSDKVITRALMELVGVDGSDAKAYFHDLSPYAESVLANVTDGSLRKDLNLFLEREDIDWLEGWGWAEGKSRPPAGPLGPNGEIALSGPKDYDVLSWKSLHHWYNMHRRQLGSDGNSPLESMRNYTALDQVSNPTWNSGVLRIAPVMVRMQMIMSYGVRRKGSTGNRGEYSYDLYMYSYPVVTLWNPYSVGLNVDQWSVFLHTMPLEHTVYKGRTKITLTGSGTRNGNYNWGWPHGNMVMRFGDSGTPGLTFEPGEAKTLTYVTCQKGGFHAHDMVEGIREWRPPGPTSPRGHVGQERHLGTITARPAERISIETKGSSWDTSLNSYNRFQTTFGFRCEPKAVHRGHPERFRQQMFCGQVCWRRETDRGNPVADFISRTNFPSRSFVELDNAPQPFIHLDVRLKTMDEVQLPNKTWLHNIPQHPYAAATSTSKHREVDSATTFFAHPYTVAFEQVNGIEGLIQNQPFFGPSNRPAGRGKIVAQEIPMAPLTSLAQLQNLPQFPMEALNWSGYYFQNQAIGNSYASPGLPPDEIKKRSFPFYLGEYFAWQAGDIAGRMYSDWTWFNNDHYTIDAAPAAVVDRSYAANHLLFDDYFFSSMGGQDGDLFRRYRSRRPVRDIVTDFFNGEKPLSNPAYRAHLAGKERREVINSLVSTRRGVTNDAHQRVAAHLMATGGFNVNSTSVPAWAVMLGSSHLKRPVTMNSRGGLVTKEPARFVVSRFSVPVGGAAGNKPGANSEDDRWLGYRELTEEELRQLAEAIVEQVKKRGPFRSLGEFVNRRLTTDPELARYGALQAALEDPDVEINDNYRSNEVTKSDITQPRLVANYAFPEAALGSRYQGTPAYISQADILTPIAPVINARSDTFLVRGYGEARSADGNRVLARAWCEAVVQRTPDYLDPADEAFVTRDELTSEINEKFGRRFVVKSFRWVPPTEIEDGEGSI
jgi:hypothetical protein